ncbi:hypothetical protein [Geobacter anodireducens]|uniref:Uncharacterized protein n=1 Tax=Geobacter soli TaxID=1510391 RepID=A0A0C1U0Q1_9BACT|nr:hypothetical protein [Geobacter soli]ANA39616.1 hypothetical protein A2G06_03705 [Geobacter anodireducens]KIE41390.1 hypothetical protein SE37_01470 [Geobacter soli]HMN01992.1 hypothetical protein [Geobacter anodireducens]
MNKQSLIVAVVGGALSLSAGVAPATDQERVRERIKENVRTEAKEQERIYGSQLMTKKERAEYRARVHAAKTAEERDKIRKEHHERMKERARERGLTLPDEPPVPGGGMGPAGMGPAGKGMGAGGGRNR